MALNFSDQALYSIYGLNSFDPRGRAADYHDRQCQINTKVAFCVASGFFSLMIACFAAAGTYSSFAIGAFALTAGAVGYILKLSFGRLHERKFYVLGLTLVAAAFLTIGVLGCAGMLSGAQVGWGMIGIFLAGMIVKGVFLTIDIQKRLSPECSFRELLSREACSEW